MSARRDAPDLSNPSTERPLWQNIAVVALIVLAAVVACNKVRNFDTFWHLKSGQWMIEHHQVLGHDPFTTPEATPNGAGDGRPGKWVNVHWLFQVVVAVFHWIGGFAGLVVLKMAVFAGAVGVFALWLRRRIPPALLMASALAIIIGIEGRIRVRPEIFTFLLFVTTLVLVESVRQGGSPRRLWWLVPINIVWVNMHGLYIVGVVAVWAALIGAFIDRLLHRETTGALATGKALLPVVVATAACFVSPWPVEAALHPLLLQTRVTGEQSMYTFGVSELRPTYRTNIFKNVSVMAGLILALLALEAMRVRRRSVPTGHVFWYLGFLALGVMAVRNVALFCIPAGFLLAVHGGEWFNEIARRRPSWRKIGSLASATMLLLLAATAAAYATETVYRRQRRQNNRFGLGLAEGLHPVDMAKWLGKSELTGDVLPLNFGDGGVFIYYSYPSRKVWMDGRLEVHSLKRFERLQEYRTKMLSSYQAADPAETPLPPTVRFVVVRFEATKHIEALSNCPRFKLLYVDRAGICFARIPLAGEQGVEQLRKWHEQEKLPPANLDRFDLPLESGPARPLLDVETAATWYRRNVPPAHWQMGAVFYSLGLDNLAIRYLTAADRLRLQEPISRMGMLAQSHQRLSEYWPIEPDLDLPADPNLARALALYEKMNLEDLSSEEAQTFALVRIRALIKGRQIDAAVEATKWYLENLPIPRRWQSSGEAPAVRDAIKVAHDAAQARREQFDFTGLTPAERALLLLRKDVGLINRAVAELESGGDLPARARMLLGDLYLRKGLTDRARKAYDTLAGEDDWAVLMRRGLCDWADGDFPAAEAQLAAAARAAPARPEPVVYLALLYEQLGKYQAAADLLSKYAPPLNQPADSQPARLLRQIEARLKVRGYEVL